MSYSHDTEEYITRLERENAELREQRDKMFEEYKARVREVTILERVAVAAERMLTVDPIKDEEADAAWDEVAAALDACKEPPHDPPHHD